MKENLNPREEIVFLLRGLFACRVISSLSNLNQNPVLLKKKFKISDFKKIKNKKLLSYILNYLIRINLISIKKNQYTATDLGKKIFVRYGSFLLLDSYKDYMYSMESNLLKKDHLSSECDRLENVIGSGQTNGRKFFPEAIKMISKNQYDVVIDIACGDGNFLEKINEILPNSSKYALDISKIAVDKTVKNLKDKNILVNKIVSDGKNIDSWKKNIKLKDRNKKILISMWYFLHEISKSKKINIINLLKKIKKIFPNAHLLIGEIYKIDDTTLCFNRHSSIMPEYLLFHEMSGQGILTFDDYKSIFLKANYKILKQKHFDLIKKGNKKIPTSSITLIKS